jgi:SAM-dependent methyltransferase
MTSGPSARDFWDREITAQTHVSWMEDPLIREAINARIGGREEPAWPIDWLDRWLAGRKFDRALSIGCGSGALERDLVKRGLCRVVDAFDGSPASLHIAQKTSVAEGLQRRIHYYAADFNEPALPSNHYDIVFFHQSAHHVAKLEKLFRRVLLSLKPGGLLYLDEYVGPSRHEWSEELLAPQQNAYLALAESLRTTERLALPIQEDDPSEAFRSGEIMEQLRIGFDVVAERPYGGTMLSVLYPALRRDALTPELVNRLIADEQRMLDAGALSFYTVVIAKPKRGVRKIAASLRYFTEPKVKRIAREVRARLSKAPSAA